VGEADHSQVDRPAGSYASLLDTALLNAVPLGVIIHSTDGGVIAFNEAALAIFGTTAERMRTAHAHSPEWSLLNEDLEPIPAEQTPFHVAVTTGNDMRNCMLWAVNERTGTRRRLRMDALSRPAPDGGSTWIYMIFEDVTDHLHAQEELRRSESRYRKVFEILPIGLWIADKNGALLSGNPAGVRIWGAEPHVSQNQYGVFRARRLPTREEIEPGDWALSHTVNEGVTVIDELLEIDAFDGSKRIILNYTAPVLDEQGRIDGAIVVNQDVTQRIRAEEALRAREAELRAVFNTIGSGVFLLDADATITMANDTLTELLGIPAGTAVGRNYYEFVCEAERPASADSVRQGVEGNLGSELTLRRYRRADGSTFIGELRGSRMVGPDGSFRALVGVLNDVTRIKAAEEERLDLERRLLHAQKLESLGVLAGGIAHDFNNLLMAVLGNLDLALMDLSPVDAARSSIEEALRATKRASDLTRQMLSYSGKGQLETRMINLSELVQENAFMFRAAINRNVTLNLFIEPDVPFITADPGQMQQVVMNLITNASEAIGERPGVVTLSTGLRFCNEEYLSLSRLDEKPPPGVFVWLEVRDTGVGMDAHTQARLFDPFFTTKFTGRGLGMSAVLGIVRGHGGAIMVESTPGKGSTLRVLLPAGSRCPVANAQPGGSEAHGADDSDTGEAPRGTVLVVDDEELVRDLGVRAVRRLGYESIGAADGKEAIRLFRESAEDIVAVLLDLTMPRMGGLATFRELRRLDPAVAVILCSGYDEQEVSRRFQGEGVAGFVQKPYELRQLRKELERATRRIPVDSG